MGMKAGSGIWFLLGLYNTTLFNSHNTPERWLRLSPIWGPEKICLRIWKEIPQLRRDKVWIWTQHSQYSLSFYHTMLDFGGLWRVVGPCSGFFLSLLPSQPCYPALTILVISPAGQASVTAERGVREDPCWREWGAHSKCTTQSSEELRSPPPATGLQALNRGPRFWEPL